MLMTIAQEQLIPTWVEDVLTPVEKLEAHQLGLKHKAVSVFVFYDGKLLLQQRALSKYHSGGLWANTCCTHPMWGEADRDCSIRRLKDELGMELDKVDHKGQIEYRADVGNGLIEHEIAQIFEAKLDEEPMIKPNPEEVMAYRWISISALKDEISKSPDTFTKWIAIYLQDHSDMISA